MAIALLAALASSGTSDNYVRESSKAARIAFEVPAGWVVDDESTLLEQGFVAPPGPLYTLVASPSSKPSAIVLGPASVPWVFVSVETMTAAIRPAQLYELAPAYVEHLAAEDGVPVIAVKTLETDHIVHQGGLSGSSAAVTIVTPSGSTSFDELAYMLGNQLWLVIAGCSATCYDRSRRTVDGIVNSVKVGTAS